METAGCDANELITDCNLRTVQEFFIIGQSNHKSGKVVFAISVKPWHFSSFAPDKRAVCFQATYSNTLNNIPGLF